MDDLTTVFSVFGFLIATLYVLCFIDHFESPS